MSNQNKLFAWQETKVGLAIIAVLDFFISYIFASLAIDTGSLVQWFIAIVFLALALTAAIKFFKRVAEHDNK